VYPISLSPCVKILCVPTIMVMRISNIRFQLDWIYSQHCTIVTTLIRKLNTQINRFKKSEICDFWSLPQYYICSNVCVTQVLSILEISASMLTLLYKRLSQTTPKCIDYFNVLTRVLLIINILHADIEINLRYRGLYSFLVNIFTFFVALCKELMSHEGYIISYHSSVIKYRMDT